MSSRPSIGKFSDLLLFSALGLAVVMTGFLLYWAIFQITRPYPMEYRENIALLNTGLLAGGENPYSLEHKPEVMNLFGIAYHWVVAPVSLVFGNTFLLHRLISLVALLVSSGLIWWVCRKDTIRPAYAVMGALLFLCYHLEGLSITARPDSIGLMFFLGSTMIPYCFNYSRASLGISIVFGLLGFLSKSYFFVGMPLVALFLFLRGSRWEGIQYGFAAGGAMLGAIFCIHFIYPTYFTEIYFIVMNAASRDWGHLRKVGGEFLVVAGGLLAVLVLSLPIKKFPLHFATMTLGVMSLIMVFKLGLHNGNGILYYHQFLTPFLIWGALVAAKSFQVAIIPVALLTINLLVMSSGVRGAPRDYSEQWKEIERVVAPGTNVFHLPHVGHLLAAQGKKVYDSGATEYWYHASSNNFTAIKTPFIERGKGYQSNLEQMVRTKQFDRILVNPQLCRLIPFSLIESNYVIVDVLPAPMAFPYGPPELFNLQLWVPRKE